jgi:hypothetical protein
VEIRDIEWTGAERQVQVANAGPAAVSGVNKAVAHNAKAGGSLREALDRR